MDGARQTRARTLIGGLAAAAIVLAVASAAVVAGCGSSDTKTVTQTVTSGDTNSTTPTSTTGTTATGTSTTSSEPVRVRRLKFFKTPSRNIGCSMYGGATRCDIRKHSWTAPPKPANCDLDWGDGLGVDRSGKAYVICAGDTTLDPKFPTLAYGEDSRVGNFKCASRESGVTCTSLASGHGFLLNRERYRLF